MIHADQRDDAQYVRHMDDFTHGTAAAIRRGDVLPGLTELLRDFPQLAKSLDRKEYHHETRRSMA